MEFGPVSVRQWSGVGNDEKNNLGFSFLLVFR